MARKSKKKCSLVPHKKRDILTIQEVKQKVGWHISAFNLPDNWSYTEGDGVVVAVLDTGIDLDHPDLMGNLLDGYNVIDPSSPPEDDNDHGTAVAGMIAALNNDLGIVGVAPKTKIVPVKVLDAEGCGNMDDVAKGIRWATDLGVDMISLSLGCPRPLASVRTAIQAATRKGIPVFCAGGNVSKNEELLYPARYPESIAVAALDQNYRRADFSNTGKMNLDFLAPGVDVCCLAKDGWYTMMSGSSIAQPFVCGVAALMLSAKRKYKLRVALDTVDDYRNVLRNHGVNLGRKAEEDIMGGFGIIDPDSLAKWLRTQE